MTARVRLVGPDVTRAVALIGVVVMNYHGFLNGYDARAEPGSSLVERLFDPWEGILSTRFAATFVLVAGVGVSLLARSALASGERRAVSELRWRLARRGVLLYACGYVLDWIWPGTILVYYGAMFVVAACIVPLRSRWLAAVGAAAAVAAASIQWWVVAATQRGHDVSWLTDPNTALMRSPRGLLIDMFVDGTHPLLPWLAFLCAGMVLGRMLPNVRYLPVAAAAFGVTMLTYLTNHVMTSGHADDPVRITLWSTQPFERGLLYTVGTLGTALAAFCIISWIAERTSRSALTRSLQAAGQMTLTIYVAHALTYNVVVDWLGWVTPGLGAALLFALLFWIAAILIASMWVQFAGMGPLERVYRHFGG